MGDRPAISSAVESGDLLALAEEAAGFGIIEWDVANGTVRMSPHALAVYGLAAFDGSYETLLALVYREDRPRAVAELEQAFADRQEKVEIQYRIVRPIDGALRWIAARRLIFYGADGKPVRMVGVSIDVTDQKRATAALRTFTETLEDAVRDRTRELEAQHEARRKAEELLRQAQKMEAVGQLTGGVAHDFNNLLTVIIGGLETIGRHLPKIAASASTQRLERARDMAMQGAQRAAILTKRLLAFSRQQALEPRPIDVNRLVSGVSGLLRPTLGEVISLESVLAGGLWLAHADENQLENAILNLAVNARDAMPMGGRLTIETANASLDRAYVSGLAEPVEAGQYVLIAVADNGTGMDAAALERAFEPFFTTKATGKGTGLGLSQVYGFVRQSGGHVRLYSEPGQGTTVKIYLPRYRGDDLPGTAGGVPERAHGAIGGETVLVVEDDEALRTYAYEVLSELGYHVMAAPNATAALEMVDRGTPVDLLFTDVVMPGSMNGRQLADEVLRRRPELKVLFTTGYTRNAIIHHGRLDPGVHLIGKPYTFEELSARVRALLDDDRT